MSVCFGISVETEKSTMIKDGIYLNSDLPLYYLSPWLLKNRWNVHKFLLYTF